MPDFEVREVDVDDEAQLHEWWRASHDGATVGRPYDTYATWELARVAYPDRHPDWDFVLLTVLEGGRVVAAGMVNMPLEDNLSNAYLEVYVPEPERRRGVGTALLAAVEAAAVSRGRSVLVAEASHPAERHERRRVVRSRARLRPGQPRGSEGHRSSRAGRRVGRPRRAGGCPHR